MSEAGEYFYLMSIGYAFTVKLLVHLFHKTSFALILTYNVYQAICKEMFIGDMSVVEISLCYWYFHLFHVCIGIDCTVYSQLSMCACIIHGLCMHDGKLLMTKGEGGKYLEIALSAQTKPLIQTKAWTIYINTNHHLVSCVLCM
jgi:hypothetical protein